MKTPAVMAVCCFVPIYYVRLEGDSVLALVHACLRRAVFDRLHVDACVHGKAGVGKSDLGVVHD